MKGVTYITDENNQKKAIVIDLKTLQKNDEEIHELIDVLVAESRVNEPLVSWEKAKKQLKDKGKL